MGAAIGNMACIHNIVAVAAMLGLSRKAPESPTADRTESVRAGLAQNPVSSILRLNSLPLLVAAAVTVALGLIVSLL